MPFWTNEEYLELAAKHSVERQKINAKLLKVCRDLANSKPIKFWGREEPEVWGCILDSPIRSPCCDCCPAADECPYEYKLWSK